MIDFYCEYCGAQAESKIVDEILLVICRRKGCQHIQATADPKQVKVARFGIGASTPDELAQEQEVSDDCAGAIASLHEQIDEREEALKLMADHYFTATDWEGPGALCEVCTKAALEDCGPKVEDSEPCEAFHNAENRYEKWAPVRKILGE